MLLRGTRCSRGAAVAPATNSAFASSSSCSSLSSSLSSSSSSSSSASTCRRFTNGSAWPPAAPILKDNVYKSFMDAVGNTSLIRLRGPSEVTGCNILGKCEFENPGGSVKDRAAAYIVKDAEERGILVPGKRGLIVEGTAGNTGIGLAHAANARGYDTVIVMPDTQSKEKKDALRNCGGGVIVMEVPAVPFKNPANYVHVATRLTDILRSSLTATYEGRILYANQWSNPANRRAHVEGTGPEIWAQTGGNIDAFSCATGTGGTLTGVSTFLKQKNPKIKIVLTDPCGAGLVNLFHHGELKANGESISEGIGQMRVTGLMQDFKRHVDDAMEIPDKEALPAMYKLLADEGLSVGSSTAINVAGAMRVARLLGPGHTIVTVLCDSGNRYASRIYNPTFLRQRNLQEVIPDWLNDQLPESALRTTLKREIVNAIKPPAHAVGSS